MEDKDQMVSSRYALEFVGTRLDKTNFRLVVALILTIVLLFVSNAIWAYVWLQYDYVDEWSAEETVTIDSGEGNANYANNGGSVINGENNSITQDYPKTEEAEEEEEVDEYSE